jgi:outer membrane protein OmpA-like peptidoglycan-associated protein
MNPLISHRLRGRHIAGNSLVPILIITAALGISTAIFFLFTKKKMQSAKAAEVAEAKVKAPVDAPKQAPGAEAPGRAQPDKSAAKGTTAAALPSAMPPTAPAPAPAASFGFARPLDLGKQMARSLAAGDFAMAGKLAAAADPAQSGVAAELMEKLLALGFKPGSEDQVELLGLVENRTRIALPLMKPGNPAPIRLQLDIERDERMGWKVAKITVPKEAAAALAAVIPAAAATPAMAASVPLSVKGVPAAASPPVPPPVPPAPVLPKPTAPAMAASKTTTPLFAVEETQDALSFASDFVRLLLEHDFASARRFVDEKKVPVERLVGLCIVFEEGQYRLKPSKPLIVTVANPEVSWVIAQVESESLQQSTEFGLELKREGATSAWKVAGVNLSQILGSFAQSATKLGIPYTPIVQNPKGGESLALYFEYDRAELHPRAQKQLEVIAGMLKADPGKKLRITGHTDARGNDSYNINLSQSRAESVKRQLVALGVPSTQVETTGLGKAQPLGPNQKADGSDDPEGRSRNRRAEIFLDF